MMGMHLRRDLTRALLVALAVTGLPATAQAVGPASTGAGQATSTVATDPAPAARVGGARSRAESQDADPPYSLDQTFRLSSLPGAERTIYLDFDGHLVSGTRWNSEKGLPATTYAGLGGRTDSATFTEAEQVLVQQVWQRVADDFAPFAVNVTTADPGEAALVRTAADDQAFGMRVLFSSATDARTAICGDCAGAAHVQVFDVEDSAAQSPVWVFPDAFAGHTALPDRLAQTASHELGHTLGLSHDGRGEAEYDPGHGYWSPLMGLSSGRPLTQWSSGDFPGATDQEDDLAVIAATGLPLRADDHGDSPGTTTTAVTSGRSADGVIGTAADRDVVKIVTTCESTLSAAAAPATGGNLDLRLRLLDRGSSVRAIGVQTTVGSESTVSGLGARLGSGSLPAGAWFVEVDGDAVVVGPAPAGGSSPRSAYGSLGAWTMTVTATCTNGSAPPGEPTVVGLAPVVPGVLVGTWSAAPDGPAADAYRVQLFDVHGSVAGPFDIQVGSRTATTSATTAGGSYQFGGLDPSTLHAFRVQALVDGRVSPSSAATGRTLPAAVVRLGATRVTPTSFTVYWTAPPGSGADVTGYVLTVNGRHRLHPATTRRIPLTGLAPGGTYDVAVRAATHRGNGPPVSFRLRIPPATAPGALTGIRAVPGPDGPPRTLTVHWGPAPDGGAAIQGYRVVAHRVGSTERVIRLAPPWARSQSLELGRGTWMVDVQAYNRVGFGPASRTGTLSPR